MSYKHEEKQSFITIQVSHTGHACTCINVLTKSDQSLQLSSVLSTEVHLIMIFIIDAYLLLMLLLFPYTYQSHKISQTFPKHSTCDCTIALAYFSHGKTNVLKQRLWHVATSSWQVPGSSPSLRGHTAGAFASTFPFFLLSHLPHTTPAR